MPKVVFLSIEDILYIHRCQVFHSGGSSKIRNRGLLESSIMVVQSGYEGQFLHRDVFEMAAAYLYHITQNHPFIDGNKRTGAAAADVFLLTNGFDLRPKEQDFERLVFKTAAGQCSKKMIADFFRKNSRKI